MGRKILSSILIFTLFISATYAQSWISQTIQHDGKIRSYDIYVPAVYDGTTAVPLMFSFHGGGGYIAGNIAINDLSNLADTANFIAVYPQALADPNDGGTTLWIHKDPSAIDDVIFIDALIDSISTNYQIDLTRVYACGYSHGGEFTLSLACRLNNRIAAIGVVARTMQTYTYDNCSPVHPTGVITILGTDDYISDYNGIWWQGVQYYVSAKEMHHFWAIENNCDTVATVTNIPDINTSDGSTVERNTWSTNSGCAYVEELKVIGGGHDWPGSFGNMDIDATQEIWQFASRYDLNGLINCGLTSIEENFASSANFKAYPNPFNDQITLENKTAEIKTFRLYSTVGKLILSGEVSFESQTIDLTALPANIYFLEIENQAVKLVKTR